MRFIFGSFKTLTALCVVVLTGLPLVACAHPTEGQITLEDSRALLAPTDPALLGGGHSFAGSYLAARFAQRQQDWVAAQHYMNAVVNFDENNQLIVHRAFLLSLGAGEWTAARRLADRLIAERDGTGEIDLPLIFSASEALARSEYKTAIELVGRLPDTGFGQYTKPLITAWAMAGAGERDAAIEFLRGHADDDDPTFNLHAGMIYDVSGDAENAARHFTAALDDSLTLHNALLLAEFFTRHGDAATAARIYDGIGPLYAPRAKAKTGNEDRRMVRSYADGAAVAMFEMATLLFERRYFDTAQIYARLVQALSPRSDFGRLMIGDIASIGEHYPEALASYESIRPASPLHLLAQLRIAEAFESADLTDAAEKVLRSLAAKPEARHQAMVALGDLHRRRENFVQAVSVYDEILAEIGEPTEAHWALVYARGMSLERANDWERAEKDLLLALTFQPDNPMILNYIGYTWVDKGVNLQKAVDFIRRAVALRPDDGYILDSYGWAYYRMGDMGQAVYWLEKSVALVPDDSTILDHLADAYWQTGRHSEARFKWLRAKELSKDADFRAGIDRKIKRGIEPAATVVVQKDTSL